MPVWVAITDAPVYIRERGGGGRGGNRVRAQKRGCEGFFFAKAFFFKRNSIFSSTFEAPGAWQGPDR